MSKFWKSGDPYIWLTGVALMFSLLMVIGLIYLIMSNALGFFWPSNLAEIQLKEGNKYLGFVLNREKVPTLGGEKDDKYRIRVKIGNRDLYGLDFKWIPEDEIESISYPKDAVVLERREWGDMYGFINEIEQDGKTISMGNEDSWPVLLSLIPESTATYKKIKKIGKYEIGDINYIIKQSVQKINGLEKRGGNQNEISKLNDQIKEQEAIYKVKEEEIQSLYKSLAKDSVVIQTIDGGEKDIALGSIIRAYQPNNMNLLQKLGFYFSKIWEFVSDDPREANTEGGVFPAIFGTVIMVLIMSIMVLPFGVLAALYLSEYAKQGSIVKLVRICVNNLAGVPSIVFGIFGVGFFIYGLGSTIDQFFFSDSLPTPTYGTGGIFWASLTLALLTVPVVIVATEEGLAAVPKDMRAGSLALGATKFETIWKVVLPSSLPAILTGLILAIARATGEVAPLMITGVVKLAPELPIDGRFPFLHLERKFMHLGFHIYDVGFQSPNVEAAKPMVFATALLLILIVVALSLGAIILRNKLRKKYTLSAV